MNNRRRKNIIRLIEQLEILYEGLENIKMEEEEYLENIPENLQESVRYENSEDSIEKLTFALDYFTDTLDSLKEIE